MKRTNFSSIPSALTYPHFLDIQLKSFKEFMQLETPAEQRDKEGLFKAFQEYFPISDSRENYSLSFIDYIIDPPQYSTKECLLYGLTYAISLKVKFKLLAKSDDNDDFDPIEQDVFLGKIPYITSRGSFIINGAERVIVSQLHRSPGVFFSQSKHPSGVRLYSARVIPFKGSWIEFATDSNHVMYAYIDRKKKFPVTTLLRAIGYGSDKDILNLFNLCEEVKVTKQALDGIVGRRLAARVLHTWIEDFADEDTGEVVSVERHKVILERDTVFKKEDIAIILESNTASILLHKEGINASEYSIIYNTLQKDNSNSEKEALEYIYKQLKDVEAPDEQTARDVIQGLFFSEKRYDLGEVGRYRINKKLGLDISFDQRVLTPEGILRIIEHLLNLVNAKAVVDDIDHLSNRRVRTVGELLSTQVSAGLSRMARIIRERMNVRDNEDFKPVDLINSKTLISVINSFFGTNQLSQFMDQTNPLAEITHKRRVSALGPGGLSRERAGFEVRDVHYTHYGRLCTIETPEGPNIGLISSLCVYAKVNNMGFIETPYRVVKNGVVTKDVVYLTAEEEETGYIAQANAPIDKDGNFINPKVKTRYMGDFPLVSPEMIKYMDTGTNQIVSVAASLIPFLEHDDANRALMGSNMQRQAVPLLCPEAPIVGTGMEETIAKECGNLIVAEKDGEVRYVDAKRIEVTYDAIDLESLTSFGDEHVVYDLIKFRRTNQDTCVTLNPIVSKGQRIKEGQVLCEGFSTREGELALGANLKVAFMPWRGYNFEDAILISERVVKEDVFTSLHIEEHQLEVRDMKRGEEEFTSEIPNVSEEAIRHLDETGIIRIGAQVKEGDILIGKITPKGEADPTPEEKLLRAIFGDKAGDVKDASLRASPGLSGIIIDTRRFSRPRPSRSIKRAHNKNTDKLKEQYKKDLLQLRAEMIQKLYKLLEDKKSQGVKHKYGEILVSKNKVFTLKLIEEKLFPTQDKHVDEGDYAIPQEVNLIANVSLEGWTQDTTCNQWIARLIRNYIRARNKISAHFRKDRFAIEVGDDLPNGVLELVKVYIAKKRKLKVGDKMAGRHGNKGVVARILPAEDMPFLPDGTPVDIVLNPLGVPSRMNIGQIYETILGWAGYKLNKKYMTPIFDGASPSEVEDELKAAHLPPLGKTTLYDGLTGEPFDQKVTVGMIYMMKLGHLVDDKVHARSIGPYSLITQQPLGGKSQFGGQRFGEMEVWALEAFGASHVLREMLTVKSDDVVGRSKIYESIVRGENMPEPNIPESFNVLVHELRGLNLCVTLD